MSLTPTQTIPYLQKDIVERRVVTASSEQQIRTALQYIAEFNATYGVPFIAGPSIPVQTWEPSRRY